MRRILLWVGGLIVVVALVFGIYVYRQLTHLEHQKLTDDVHVIFGMGGNVGVLKTGEGTVIVDTMTFPMQGERIRALAEELTGEPVVTVVNTHYHFDHTHGNPGFDPNANVVATKRTREHLLDRDAKFWEGREAFLPKETFDHEHSLEVGNKTIRLVHPGRGHTDGDLVALFVDDEVVHTGDLLSTDRYPNIDLEAGGTVQGWPATLDRVLALDFDRVIPGHGPVTDRKGVENFQAFFVELWEKGQAAAANGWTLDETIQKTELTKDAGANLASYVIPFLVRLDRDFVVRRAWEEATGAVKPKPAT